MCPGLDANQHVPSNVPQPNLNASINIFNEKADAIAQAFEVPAVANYLTNTNMKSDGVVTLLPKL